MKLLIFLFLLLSMILAFLYLCRKMGIDVDKLLSAIFSGSGGTQYNLPPQNNQQIFPLPNLQPQSLYKENKVDYENFATLFLACLKKLAYDCGLDCPGYADRIYCASLEDRIKCVNGYVNFLYEVPVEVNAAIHNGALSAGHINTNLIEEKLKQNLQGYLGDYYYYSGHICVWEISQNKVRIEVAGVARNYTNQLY